MVKGKSKIRIVYDLIAELYRTCNHKREKKLISQYLSSNVYGCVALTTVISFEPAFTYAKSTIETPEQYVKPAQS